MNQSILSDRYQNILRATIQHYIATAEPVGSKTIAQEYDFNVSSATIRNAMGKLEKAGFLYQPHTSAGRIPSDSGYRIYVDRLIVPDEKLGRKLVKYLNGQAKDFKGDFRENCSGNFEDLLERAAQILAALSGYIALITLPQTLTNQLKHLQLVLVNPQQAILIAVTDGYETQSILMDLPLSLVEEELEQELIEGELQIISNFLNRQLTGKSLSELAKLDLRELDDFCQSYADFLQGLLEELSLRLRPSAPKQILIRGISEVLRQPEFSQLEQVQMLLQLLEEEREKLRLSIFQLPQPEPFKSGVTIRIGAENILEPMRGCTLIAANYHQDTIPVGSVGVIGPTRMIYKNAIPLVESTADYLSDVLIGFQ